MTKSSCIACLVFLSQMVFCVSMGSAATIVDNSVEKYLLGKDLYYLKEESLALTLDEVLQPSNQSRFQASEQEIPNFGIADKAYWAKLSIDYRGAEETNWLVEIDYIYLDNVDFYSRDKDGNYRRVQTGDQYEFENREIQLHSFVFPVHLFPNEVNDIYVRIDTMTTLQMPFVLWESNLFSKSIADQRFWYGIFYGAMIIMFLYNLMIYIAVRDHSYIYYLGYLLAHTLAQLSINGLGFEKVWPGSPYFQNISIPIFMAVTNILALMFTRSFLMTQTLRPGFDLWLKLLITFGCIGALLTPIFSQAMAFKFALILATVSMTSILLVSFWGVFQKQRRAYYFALAWSCLCLGIILKAVNAVDLLPTVFVTAYGAQLGGIIECLFLAFALADRINTDRAEKVEALDAALSANEEQLLAEQKLRYRSFYDPLTKMPNRNLLGRELNQLIERLNRYHDSLSLVCIHINNFHDINHTLGHETGDVLLRQVTEDLNASLDKWPRPTELGSDPETGDKKYLALIEGVYLAVVYENVADSTLNAGLRRLSDFLDCPVNFGEFTLDIGGHIGVAKWPAHTKTAEGLVRKGMMAVRAAKWSNQNILDYSQKIDHYSTRRLSLMGEMKEALNNQEFEIYYHPKVDLRTHRVVSMEALIRWNHPKRGLLPPSEFVDLAEGTRIIHPLTKYILEKAVVECAKLNKQGIDISVAVNVSARNLLDKEFVRVVNRVLTEHRFDPSKLVIEVLESSVIDDMETTLSSLKKLDGYGIKIALDDFGTGYSSLAYLRRFPIHEIKIDCSFVKGMAQNQEDRLIVESSMAIAHELGLRVVAEGVEDKRTYDELAEMGCDLAQGFYLARPMPIEKLLPWLEQKNKTVLPKLG